MIMSRTFEALAHKYLKRDVSGSLAVWLKVK
jgi:hypothetical protein